MKNTLRYTVIDFAVCGWVKWFSDNRSRRNEICLKNRTHWCRQRDIIELWDDSGRRGRDQKLFKKRFRLHVRKFAFSNRVVNDWNSLSSQCVNCCTVNSFFQLKWNRKLLNYISCVLFEIAKRCMAFKHVLAHASCVLIIIINNK